MNRDFEAWKSGVRDGLPLILGYIAVSFTFGIVAANFGLNPFQSAFMSGTNFTSAGQFAGLTLIATSATYFEMALTQLIINSRYFLMTASLSQKINPNTSFIHRAVMAFGATDEIFGISIASNGMINPYYTYGLMTVGLPSWILGTLLGVFSGSILPDRLISAFSIALYGMLVSVIIPPTKGNKVLAFVIFISMLASFLFSMIPILSNLSSGVKIIILTVVIAGIAAILFPVKEDSISE